MRTLIGEFAGNTSAHGWGKASQTTSKLAKAAWIFTSSACSIVALFLIIKVVIKYCEFNTKDSIRVSKDEAVFPSVTVCPLTPISRKGMATFRKELAENNSAIDSMLYYNNFLYVLGQYNLNISSLQNASEELQLLYNQSYKRLHTNAGYYENYQQSERLRYTIKQKDFIPSCKYQSEVCSEELYHSGHHEHFNCFTFNGPLSNISSLDVDSGPSAGLSLILYLDIDLEHSSFYDPDYPTSGSQGVRVVIHEQGTWPDPENDGFDIKAGNSVNVALSSERRELMGQPWGDCADHNDIKYDRWKYSTKACLLTCIQRLGFKRCGCIRGSLPVDDKTKDVEFCANIQSREWLKSDPNVTLLRQDLNQLNCSLQEYSLSDILAQEGCECKENCKIDKYDIMLSDSEWPMKGIEFHFYCDMIMKLGNYNENSSIYQAFHDRVASNCSSLAYDVERKKIINKDIGKDLREQFLRLNVYFKDSDTKVTTQTEDFSIGSMVSEIGGSLGLLIGMSVISISEVFILCLGILAILIRKSKAQTKVETFKDKMEYP
ncbi:unnamed protein product [Owenia fusiformis]|uniref:Uncharacterized protein n=1 Tax=Owenia fusiformis TaxID=6347 RepID=A0A8J1TZF9_OWEFU|nr:unnamed protein product [Owenia fusiformis]